MIELARCEREVYLLWDTIGKSNSALDAADEH